LVLPVASLLAMMFVRMANREPLHLHSPLPGVFEAFDAVGREDEVEVERAVLELYEVLAPDDLLPLGRREVEPQLEEGGDQRRAVGRIPGDEDVRILCRVGEAEQDGARLAEEQVAHAVLRERIADLLGLAILKRGHNPASPAGSPRTTAGTPRSSPTSGRSRRRGRVCRS